MSHVQAIKSGSIQSAHNRAALNSSSNTTSATTSSTTSQQKQPTPNPSDMPPWRRPRHESMNETTTTATYQAGPPPSVRPSVIARRKHHTSMSEGQSTTRVVPSVVIPVANPRSGRITIGSRNRGAGKQTINSAEAEAKSRFYPVVKEARPAANNSTLLKRKTRHSTNPPVESHVGWVMDHRLAAKREHKTSTSSTSGGKFNMSTGTTPIDDSTLMQNYRQHFQTQDLVPFHHPSYTLLKQNGFTQQLYCKFRKRCLAGNYCVVFYFLFLRVY